MSLFPRGALQRFRIARRRKRALHTLPHADSVRMPSSTDPRVKFMKDFVWTNLRRLVAQFDVSRPKCACQPVAVKWIVPPVKKLFYKVGLFHSDLQQRRHVSRQSVCLNLAGRNWPRRLAGGRMGLGDVI